MRAAIVKQFGAAENIFFTRNIPVPELAPNSSHVLVRVHAAGLNPVDTYIRAGQYSGLPKLPYTPGKEGAGVVVKIPNSDESTSLAVGDRVWFKNPVTGSCADFCLVPQAHCFPVPRNLSFAQAATLGVAYMTALRALQKANVVDEEVDDENTSYSSTMNSEEEKAKTKKILVHGASGGVGLATVQLRVAETPVPVPKSLASRAFRCHVFGTVGTEWGEREAREQGARGVYWHSDPGYLDKQIRPEHPEGFDAVIEMAAHRNLNEDLTLVRMHGHVVIVGSRGTLLVDPRRVMSREVAVLGLSLFAASHKEFRQMGTQLNELAERGIVVPRVDREYSLEEIAQAHRDLEQRLVRGKLVIRVNNEEKEQKKEYMN